MNNQAKYIIAIGSSAGGLTALSEMILHFQGGVDAAYCIVLHASREGTGEVIKDKICQITALRCNIVDQPMEIEKDNIYIATPDKHLKVEKNIIRPENSPVVNGWRPSIDIFLQSAALAYADHCIGIVLSGLVEDGALGMRAIKTAGGITIIQDPREADFAFLPQLILDNCEVDHVVSLPEIGALIRALVS